MNQTLSPSTDHSTSSLPRGLVVKMLIAVNVVLFFFDYVAIAPALSNWLYVHLALWPLNGHEYTLIRGSLHYIPPFEPWQLLGYGFMHGSLSHIFFNMYALFIFGTVLEMRWGWQKFLLYYIACILGAGLTQLAVTYGGTTPTVGASGGVFGLLLAFGVLFPRVKLYLLFIPVPIDARWAVLGYGLLELTLGVTNTLSGIAHFAHLGGMIAGLPLVLYWKKQETARGIVYY